VQSHSLWLYGIAFLCLSVSLFERWPFLSFLGGGILFSVSAVLSGLPFLISRLADPEWTRKAPRAEVTNIRLDSLDSTPCLFRRQGYRLFYADVRFRRSARSNGKGDLVLRHARLLLPGMAFPKQAECRICLLRTPGEDPLAVFLKN
jgi:hypothetical protein